LISWDLALNEKDSVIFIEYNIMLPEINRHQIYGGPFFGKYTEAILKEISINSL
jgi:hypothetical protein